jgi:hypothetical protein
MVAGQRPPETTGSCVFTLLKIICCIMKCAFVKQKVFGTSGYSAHDAITDFVRVFLNSVFQGLYGPKICPKLSTGISYTCLIFWHILWNRRSSLSLAIRGEQCTATGNGAVLQHKLN